MVCKRRAATRPRLRAAISGHSHRANGSCAQPVRAGRRKKRSSLNEYDSRNSSDRNHWRQRFVSNGRSDRCSGTQDRHSFRRTVRCDHRRKIIRAAGLFFAAARPWTSDPAARTKSSGEHLRAAFAERSLDHLRHRRRKFAGKIRTAGCSASVAVLRSNQPAKWTYIFRRGHRGPHRLRRTDQCGSCAICSRKPRASSR